MTNGATQARQLTSPILGFWHSGITVSDMERSLSFYRDGLDLEVVLDRVSNDDYLFRVVALDAKAVRLVYLRIPSSAAMLELMEFRGIERHPASARPCDPAASHISLFVADLEALHRRLLAAGFKSRSPAPVEIAAGPNQGGKAVYMLDPDEYLVELFERRPGS